ncbi:MAG: GNAT family N-acetyltransferase [Ahrensia sp.]|nr:GNAT family N-acetyltransferase [Ahrensia sp.]
MSVTIRPLRDEDFEAWYPLWQGYLTFYKSAVADDVTRHTFERICDPDGDVFGFAATEADGRLVGFVTYLFHPFTWSKAPRCYLGDLFTDENCRGKGVGRALIEAVYDAAREAGAGQVYWLTQEFNYRGRTLYDKVADKTDFIKYSKTL